MDQMIDWQNACLWSHIMTKCPMNVHCELGWLEQTWPSTSWIQLHYTARHGMPRHRDPYWVVVWTLPIISIPWTKCSTGKLGQNGLLWPFLGHFGFFMEFAAFFLVWLIFFLWNWCQQVFFLPMVKRWAQSRKKSAQIDLFWPDSRHFSCLRSILSRFKHLECMFKLFIFRSCYLMLYPHWTNICWPENLKSQVNMY